MRYDKEQVTKHRKRETGENRWTGNLWERTGNQAREIIDREDETGETSGQVRSEETQVDRRAGEAGKSTGT